MATDGSLAQRIDRIVKEAIRTSPENVLRGFGAEPAWGEALVGFASGDDPLFAFLKEDIGEFYWTPREIFDLTYGATSGGGASSSGGRLSVVAWVVPQTEATRRDQRRESRFPSRRWKVSRAYWSELTRDVHNAVVRELAALGLRAVAPEMSEHWRGHVSPRYGHASSWSQRHTAFVAGLGTFGLSDGLITPVGTSIRAGSVVVEAELPATPRRYTGHLDWCAYHADGSCADCVDRCPCGAITRGGHDKSLCEAYMQQVVMQHARPLLGDRTGGCGLCQAGVRCESGIPVRQAAALEPLTPAHVQQALDSFGLGLVVEHFDDRTATSEDAAAAIGCELAQIAKSMCLLADGRPLLVVASGERRIAEAKLARYLGVGRKKIKLAPPDVCLGIFGYAPGGVPPVGHRTPGIPVIIDESLARWDRVYAAAGTPHDNFGLTFDQLVTISGGTVIDCVVEGR